MFFSYLNFPQALIDEIGKNANLSEDVRGHIIFYPKDRPKVNLLVYKEKDMRKQKSAYTINLHTLEPSKSSPNQTPLTGEMKFKIIQWVDERYKRKEDGFSHNPTVWNRS